MTLRDRVDAYIALRRGLGFKLRWTDQLLAQFADYCEVVGSEVVTIDLALAWARLPHSCQTVLVGPAPESDPTVRPLHARSRYPS